MTSSEHRQVDIMAKLPSEISTLILDQLDFLDVINGIHVSKAWRQCICNSSANIRQHVKLNSGTRNYIGCSFSSKLYKSTIRLLSNGVKSIIINMSSWEKQTEVEILDMLTTVSFPNLRVFNIVHFSGFPCEQLNDLLQNSRHSLEEVYLTPTALTCNEILDTCPNLKRLYCQTYNASPQPQPQPQQQAQYLSLTYLRIDASNKSQIKDLDQALRRLINLQEFRIKSVCNIYDDLLPIHQYGSTQLRHICIDALSDDTDMMDLLSTTTYIDTSCFEYTVDIHNWDTATATSLLELINHSANMRQKINAVSLSLHQSGRVDNWSSFKYFTAPCLQYIKFSFTKETEEIFATVIRNCPTLQYVNIFRLLCSPSNMTMDALKTLPALRCFAVENDAIELNPNVYFIESDPICFKYVNDTVIRQFFTYHVLLDEHSTLQEVRLRNISDLEPETFKTLLKIKSLKSLNFAGFYIFNGDHNFGSVLTGKNKSLLPSQLESLVLEYLSDISDDDLQLLNLPNIALISQYSVTTAGVKRMMKNAKKLKKLTVHKCGIWPNYIGRKEFQDIMKKKNVDFELAF